MVHSFYNVSNVESVLTLSLALIKTFDHYNWSSFGLHENVYYNLFSNTNKWCFNYFEQWQFLITFYNSLLNFV